MTTYASPLSFTGATKRIAAWLRRLAPSWPTLLRVIAIGLLGAVVFVAVYLFLVVYTIVVLGLFGLLTIPFRSHRRAQRKQEELLRRIAEK